MGPSGAENQGEAENQNEEAEDSTAASPFIAWPIVLLLVGVVGWLAYRLYPAHHALPTNPSFVDNVFANNLVLFAGRLVLVAAALVLAVTAVFVVISFYQRGRAGHWLTRFGPLETQAVEDLRGEVDTWQNLWAEASTEGDELRERLARSDELIQQLYKQLEEASEELARLSDTERT